MAARYEFLTTWLLRAPRGEVWDALQDPLAWPDWWRGVESVEELDGGDGQRVGSRYRVRWRSLVPYPVEFEFEVDQVEQPLLMAGRARGGRTGPRTWRACRRAPLPPPPHPPP